MSRIEPTISENIRNSQASGSNTVDSDIYESPRSNTDSIGKQSIAFSKAVKMGSAIKLTSITLCLMIAAYGVIYTFFQGTVFIYAAVPFVISYWLSVTRLSWLAYSPVMGTISFFSIIIPPAIFMIMLLSYYRATKYIKSNNLKCSFFGSISENRKI